MNLKKINNYLNIKYKKKNNIKKNIKKKLNNLEIYYFYRGHLKKDIYKGILLKIKKKVRQHGFRLVLKELNNSLFHTKNRSYWTKD